MAIVKSHPSNLTEYSSDIIPIGLFSFAATNLEKAQTLQKEINDFLNHEQELKHATFVIDTLPASNTFNEDIGKRFDPWFIFKLL